MRAANLLPEHDRPGGMPTVLTTTSVLAGAGAVFAVVLVLVGFSYMQGHNKVSDRQDTLEALQQQVSKAQAVAARTAAQQGLDQDRVTAFTAAASGRMPWDDLLDDVSRVLPAGSWLSNLNVQIGTAPATELTPGTNTATASTVPTSFTVSGIAFTQNIVAQVIQRLELVPALSDVTLQSSSRTTVGTTKGFQFTMSANVQLPEVPR
jgi:Tfp pilus assembly protein PilN